jgi:hypothetical protein
VFGGRQAGELPHLNSDPPEACCLTNNLTGSPGSEAAEWEDGQVERDARHEMVRAMAGAYLQASWHVSVEPVRLHRNYGNLRVGTGDALRLRSLVLAAGPGALWWAPTADNWDTPSSGGRFRVGDLLIFNVDDREEQILHVHADIPAGWLPD